MEYATSGGKITGFDVDMASALAKTWGATAKPVKTAFPGLIPALNAKKCDAVISGIFVTPDRLKQAGAVPLHGDAPRARSCRPATRSTSRARTSLKGLNVVVQAGTKYEEYLKELKKKIGFNLQSYPGDNDAVAQVILGRADVDPHPGHVVRVPGQGASRQARGRLHVPGKGHLRRLLPEGRRASARQLRAGVARLQGERHAQRGSPSSTRSRSAT